MGHAILSQASQYSQDVDGHTNGSELARALIDVYCGGTCLMWSELP